MRREYLYRKSLEGKERDEYERKRKIRQALEGGNPNVRLPGATIAKHFLIAMLRMQAVSGL